MNTGYIPRRGDLVWLDFTPQAGHEQAGRRPALVVSEDAYNKKVGLALFCPITSREKGFPFEVKLPSGSDINGVILSDQLRNCDWRARRATRIGAADKSTMDEVMGKLHALLGAES